MTINKATLENLRRKSAFVDKVQTIGERQMPLFSWVDLNLTELCNRSAGSAKPCTFCPRIDPSFYPNQALHMSLALADKIRRDLRALDYRGTVVLCGFGEPMLHPEFMDIVRAVSPLGRSSWRLELVTNGDKLTAANARQMYLHGVSCIVVSMYDGPHQVAPLQLMLTEAGGVEGETFILRDRWHTEADSFGLKLTNRAGTVSVGNQEPVLAGRPCHYLAYQLTLNWNGDVLLCVQDWHRKVIFGNVANQTLLEVWQSRPMAKRRAQLTRGDRSASPCSGCNTDGCLHGFNHVEGWAKWLAR